MTAPYRRFSDPWILSVSPTSGTTQVAISSDPKYQAVGQGKARSFEFINNTASYVRLRGSTGTFAAVTDSTGHLIAPFGRIIRSSQQPDWISVQSFTVAGIPAATGACEINYGTDGA